MLIAQITDTHIKLPGKLAYRKVDTASMLRRCVQELLALSPQPDAIMTAAYEPDFPAFLQQVARHYSGRMLETALSLL